MVTVMTETMDNVHHPRIKIQSFRDQICLHLQVEWGKRRTYSGRPIKES